ncbi:MAG: hypothetical protein HXY34_13035 [Candidatus Thorarchaeota archaeon]|nr:hypothetical protein [Candidatus Thorarchaeota archaeon]
MNRRNPPKVYVAVLVLLLFVSSFQTDVRAQSPLDPVVILYDASHGPQFEPGDAANGLKLMLDMVNASTRYIVKVHRDTPINETVLRDVDILIVASPDRTYEYTKNESIAITKMLANGSSLFVLGDPMINQTSRYWSEAPFQDLGDNVAVNRFLDQLNMTGVRFSTNQTGPDSIWSDTMFDYDHALNKSVPYVIRLDSTSWDSTHPIFRDINELLVMTATLRPIDTASAVANGYKSSFAQFKVSPFSYGNTSFPNMSLADLAQHPLKYSAINGTRPPWLAAFEYDSSRVVVCGSTIMFSGRPLDLPTSDSRRETQWFYSADNSRLFMNILGWLSQEFVEAPGAIPPMLAISSVLLFVGLAYYIVKKMKP